METAPISKLLTTAYFKDGFVVDIDFDLLEKQRFIESQTINLNEIEWKIRVTTMKMIDLDASPPPPPSSTSCEPQQNTEAAENAAPSSGEDDDAKRKEFADDVHKYEGYRIGLMAMASREKDWSFVVDQFAIAVKKSEEDDDEGGEWGNADVPFGDGLFKALNVVHWTMTSIDRPVYGRAGFLNLSIAANRAYEPTGKTPPHSPSCPMLLQPASLENTCGGFLDLMYKEAVAYSGTSKRLIIHVYFQYANQLTFYSTYESKDEFQDSIGLDVCCLDCQKTFFVSLQQCVYESSFMAKNLKNRPEIDSFIIKLKIKCSSNDFKVFLQCLIPPYLRLDLIDDVSTFQNILVLACRFECQTLLQRCSSYLVSTRRIPLRTRIRLTTACRLNATTVEIIRRLNADEVEDLMKSYTTINFPDEFKIVLLNRFHALHSGDEAKEKPCCSKTLTGNV